jgi:hypothetical protein
LKKAGLVTDRSEGSRRLYGLHDEGITAVRDYLESVWGEAATRFKIFAENTPDSFSPMGNATSVRIVHHGWERLGMRGAEPRERNRRGWGGLIPHYRRACLG